MYTFPRTALAQELLIALQGKLVLSDARNGLLLAAPRRTGKSTFLQHDLRPALEAAGVLVVYVDLWADTRRDPGDLIAEAIARALDSHCSKAVRTASKPRTGRCKVNGLEVDTSKIGKVAGLTLADALRLLIDHAGKPVALIVDEAQHALSSDAGEVAMTALKSARDQINRLDAVNLMLVLSGSDRDKLSRLINSQMAPFYGSEIQRMPPLGPDFIAQVAALIEAQRRDLKPVDQTMLRQAFEVFGHRPQLFMVALGQVLSPLSGLTGRFEPALLMAAQQQQVDDERQMESDYLDLKLIEQVVLWRMLEQGPRYRPYDVEALRFYREKTGHPVSATQAQRALEALRQHTPTMVWKTARGEYAVEDPDVRRWFEKCILAGQWPPMPRKG